MDLEIFLEIIAVCDWLMFRSMWKWMESLHETGLVGSGCSFQSVSDMSETCFRYVSDMFQILVGGLEHFLFSHRE